MLTEAPDGEVIQVLLIDDDTEFVEKSASALERTCDTLRITTVATVDEANRCLESDDIDCLLCSSELPETDSIE